MKSVTLVSGLSGSGKSVVAGMVAERTGDVLLRTDVIRQGMPEEVRERRTTPEGITAVYAEMMRQARELLVVVNGVVLDGTFLKREHRAMAAGLAEETGAAMRMISVECADSVAEQRIIARAAAGTDASEAGVAVRKLQQAELEPWGADEPFVIVNTACTLEEVRVRVEKLLNA